MVPSSSLVITVQGNRRPPQRRDLGVDAYHGRTMSRWSRSEKVPRGAAYDERWSELAATGANVHGEVDLICRFEPRSVLDAGCGTGRVAVELARRGVDVVGVDLDPAMLEQARAKAPELVWLVGDLASVVVGDGDGGRRRFDVVAAPGNVLIFLEPGTEAAVVANLAAHLRPGGRLVSGFTLGGPHLDLDTFDRLAAGAGLALEARYATWEGAPFVDGGDYAVSVHRRQP
jgi:SAM-dependent methyltransferase